MMVACSGDVFCFSFLLPRLVPEGTTGTFAGTPANTMQQAVSSVSRVLLPLPVRLSRPGKLHSELGIITSYPLSSTFSKAYVPAYYSPKSRSGAPKPRFFCGCGLCVQAVVLPAPVSAQPPLQSRTALSYPHLDVGCIF